MATNVTEKDKTLNEVITWCENLEIDGIRLANTLLKKHDLTAYTVGKSPDRHIPQDGRTLPFHAGLLRRHAKRSIKPERERITMYIVRFNGVDYICATFSQAINMARKTAANGVTATIIDDEGEEVASFHPRKETK